MSIFGNLKIALYSLYHQDENLSHSSCPTGSKTHGQSLPHCHLLLVRYPGRNIQYFRPLGHCFCISTRGAAALLPPCKTRSSTLWWGRITVPLPGWIYLETNLALRFGRVEGNGHRAHWFNFSCTCACVCIYKFVHMDMYYTYIPVYYICIYLCWRKIVHEAICIQTI